MLVSKARVTLTVLHDFVSSQVGSAKHQVTPKAKQNNTHGISIPANAVFVMPLALPSIMALDAELVEEFFGNVTENIQLLYDRQTDSISLCLKE